MCGLFYQVKSVHPHAVALAYYWLTHTRKHSALRYNIDKTLLDYQINQLSMILHLKSLYRLQPTIPIYILRLTPTFANRSLAFLVKIHRQLSTNLKSIFVLDVAKIINLSASADISRPKETTHKITGLLPLTNTDFYFMLIGHLKYKIYRRGKTNKNKTKEQKN